MNLKNLAAKQGIFVASQCLYSCNGVSIFRSNKIGEEKEKLDLSQDGLDEVDLKYSNEVVAYIKDNTLRATYLPTLKVLAEEKFEDTVSTIGISPSGMNIAIGFTNGKSMIYNNLFGGSLGKFPLFSDASKIEYIGFLRDELIYGSTKDKIIFIDLLKKGTVSKIVSDDGIKNIFSSDESVIYVTNSNEIYIVDLKNLKAPLKSILSSVESEIIDIKFATSKQTIFVALKDRILNIDLKSKKTTLIKDGYELIVNISIDKDALYVGLQNGSDKIEISKNIVSSTPEVITKDSKEKTTSKDKNTIRFLTVDDSKTIRMVIKRSIQNNFENVEVAEAEDGVDALKYLKANLDTDVVFLDWNMPRMDGDEVVEEISKIPKLKHLKIIMATTEGGKERVTQMITKGVIGYLVKPLRAESINPLTQKIIEMVQKERVNNV